MLVFILILIFLYAHATNILLFTSATDREGFHVYKMILMRMWKL